MHKRRHLMLIYDGNNRVRFLTVDGVRVAERGLPGTEHAGTWIPLVPGWEVSSPFPKDPETLKNSI